MPCPKSRRHGWKASADSCRWNGETVWANWLCSVRETIPSPLQATLTSCSNAAGITGPTDFITTTPSEAFEKCLNVNTLGVFLCMKHQLLQMQEQQPVLLWVTFGLTLWLQDTKWHKSEDRRIPQRGAIVNFASVNSVMSGSLTAAYTASKHAVHGMTKSVSISTRLSH